MTAMQGVAGSRAGLARLFRPASIAVLGGKAAVEVIRQCDRMGFAGEIWPLHPNRAEVEGRCAYRSIADLPAAPDAAFLGVNRQATIEAIDTLAASGAGGAVAYAAGFAEVGTEGAELQAQLIAAAGNMPFLGPNCYGFINYLDGALLWPDQHGGRRVERGIALVTQSGNIALNLTMQARGLPIGYVITLGNQAVVGLSKTIDALIDDDRVTAIGLHIEGIDNPAGFARAAARARAKGVPVVALKAGRSEAGARLTVSHTASVAGADAVADAFLRKVGVARVHAIPALLETLKILHVVGPLPGRDIASLSCSGGEAALVADAAEGRRVRLRPLDEAEAARVRATVPPLVTVSNPLDYHTFSWGDEAALTETFAAAMAAGFDMTMLILDFPRPDRCSDADWDTSVRAIVAAARRTGGRAAVVASLPELMPEHRAEALIAAGIVPLSGIEEALAAIEAAADAGLPAGREDSPYAAPEPLPAGMAKALGEWDAKRVLAAHGLPVPLGRLVDDAGQAVAAAAEIGFPVAMKAAGAALTHKTEAGAVRLGLRDSAAVCGAAHDLLPLGEALLVEAMITDAVAELIVGVGRDPRLGLYLVVGSGGILVELVGDRRVLMIPATRDEVRTAIGSLRVAALLDGHRGKPAGDLEAALDAIMAVQGYAVTHAGRLVELDVNPLIVRPAGLGAVAVDALICMVEEAEDVR